MAQSKKNQNKQRNLTREQQTARVKAAQDRERRAREKAQLAARTT